MEILDSNVPAALLEILYAYMAYGNFSKKEEIDLLGYLIASLEGRKAELLTREEYNAQS